MKPLQAGELTLEPELTAGVMHLRWLGKSNERDPGRLLRPYLDEALTEAERDGSRVDMHFEKLEHFNSSTIAVLIQLINHARERKIALTLIYNGSLKWQSLSFEALKRALQPFNGGQATVNIRSV
jgi:hypothetical protein